MKMSFIYQVVCAAVVGLWFAGFAKATAQLQDPATGSCTVESKNQYYRNFVASYEGVSKDQANAMEAAKKYLACPRNSDDHEEVLAKLNLAVGRMLSLKNSSSEAIPYFRQALAYNSPIKTSPQTYAYLAEAYEEGPYANLSAEYKTRFEGKDETQDSLVAIENILQVVDRMIDAYARAVALAGLELPGEPSRAVPGERLVTRDGPAGPADWIEILTVFYKFRHNNSDTGLRELIGTILSRPLPPEPGPITSLPRRKK